MSDQDTGRKKARNPKLRQDICWHFGNRDFDIPIDKNSALHMRTPEVAKRKIV
jgi:hypothetical protein